MNNSAENTLINEITEFSPDVAKLVLNCTHTTLYLGRCSRKYSMVKVYCYSRCTTCKKALKWLDDNKAGYKLIDIKEDHPDEKTLRQLHKKSGLSDGMLVKRPLLITGKKVLTGFKEEDWKNAL